MAAANADLQSLAQPGEQVELHGLISRADLNGCSAVLVGPSSGSSERFDVHVNGNLISVKLSNLRSPASPGDVGLRSMQSGDATRSSVDRGAESNKCAAESSRSNSWIAGDCVVCLEEKVALGLHYLQMFIALLKLL